MAKIIKKLKMKKSDGTMSDYIPIGAEAENINVDGESVKIKLNKKPYYYNNVADMKADEKLKAGDMAITLGYYEPNDGGAGEYRIVVGNYEDDGGSYHKLDNNLFAELIIKDYILAEQYGAYGDGIHDDKLALRNMLYNCKTFQYLLTKTYKITDSLEPSYIPSGAVITGGGTIIMPSSVNRTSIIQFFNRTDKITIDNLTFQSIADQIPETPEGHTARAGARSSNLNALRIEKCDNVILTNLTFINMAYDASIRGLLYDGNFGCNHIFIEN